MALRKRPRRALVAFALLFIAAGGLWVTGLPQRAALEWIAGRALHAVVTIEGLSTMGGIHIDRMLVYADSADRKADRPSIVIRDADLGYDLLPWRNGIFPKLAISEIQLQTRVAPNGEESNLDYFLSYLGPRDSPLPARWFPRTTSVDRVHGAIQSADGAFAFDGLGLEAALDKSGNLVAEARSNAFTGTWTGSGDPVELREGFFRVGAKRTGDSAELSILAGLPGWLEADGTITVTDPDDQLEVHSAFNVCRLYGDRVSAIVNQVMPLNIEFGMADFSQTDVTFGLAAGVMRPPNGNVRGAITGLRIHDENGELLLDSDVSITGALEGGDSGRGTLAITLNSDQPAELHYTMGETAGQATLYVPRWPRDTWLAAMPPAASGIFRQANVQNAELTANFSWDDAGYKLNAALGGDAPRGPLALSLDGSGTIEERSFTGSAVAVYAQGKADARIATANDGAYAIDAEIKNAMPEAWMELLGATQLPEDLAAPLTGTVSIDRGMDEAIVHAKLTSSAITLGRVTFADAKMLSELTLNADLSQIQKGTAAIESPEGASLHLSDLTGKTSPLDLHGTLAGSLDLAAQAAELGLDDVYGLATLTATIDAQEELLRGEFQIVSNDLGNGDWALPYGKKVAGTGQWNFNLDSSLGVLEGMRVVVADGTTIAADRIDFRNEPLTLDGAFTVASDLQLLQDMEFVSDAEGTLSADVRFQYTGEALRAQYTITSNGERIALPKGAATLEHFAAQLTGNYDEHLAGSGQVSAAIVSVAGARGVDVSGTARIENDVLLMPDLRGSALGGSLAGDIRVELLEDGLPATIVLDLSEFDLARLTEEVKPPKVKMTGTANGHATILYTAERLKDFDVTAKSIRGFTLNRDLVEEVLQQESFRELFSSGPARKTLEKFLGPFDQRPFNSAELTMGLQDDRIRGQAVLLSEKTKDYNGLNLTVNLAIDSEALADVLRSLEDDQTLDIHR
ncbi:MAG: hypothetical protein AAB353_10685 [Candidatus Hydrogenedentota bacterium]